MTNLARLLLCCVLSTVAAVAQKQPAADLIVTNAKVWTVDGHHPTAEAVAVIGDKIVAVGSVSDIEAWRGPATEVIDAGGHLLLPGFNDSHVHFTDGSAQLTNVQLKDASSIEDFAQRIADHAKKLPPGEWVLGGNWDDQGFAQPRLPTKEDIDRLTPNTPVFVTRYDGHMSVANSAALRLAGVTAKTKDVLGGVIVRDKRGEPTGLLKDAAMSYVYKVMPPMSRETLVSTIRAGLRHAASLGVTSVQHMNPSYDDISVYAELASRGELTTRVYAAPMETEWQDQAKIGVRHAFGSSWLRIGALKGYADGSLGSSTAYFFDAFTDDPKNRGLLSDEMQSLPAIRERFIKADAANLQLCIHAIGDRAIEQVLSTWERVYAALDSRERRHFRARRHRIEHFELPSADPRERAAMLGLAVSVQPTFDRLWGQGGGMYEERLGPARAMAAHPIRTMLERGIEVGVGSDSPIAPLDPMLAIAALEEHHEPAQRLTRLEALKLHRVGSARLGHQETKKGALEPGRHAHRAAYDQDPLEVESVRDLRPVLTVSLGREVFRA